MENIIGVTQNKCKQCYSCVRNCPVKAVKFKDGQAQIMTSRCINCGKCIISCPQNAKIVIDCKKKAINLLKGNTRVIACLAPSFITSFDKYNYKKVIGALKTIGFSEVWEVSVGAEVLMDKINNFMKENSEHTFLSSSCPAFVTMIEKHYPELIDNLMPFVSPMIATGQIIKNEYKNESVKVVFIGPCVAKKAEAHRPKFEGIIDNVLTFEELKEIFKDKKININSCNEIDFDYRASNKGKLFPLSGGLLKNLDNINNKDEGKYIYVDGDKDCLNMIDALLKGNSSYKVIDILMCKGCIEGPKIDSDLSYYDKINKVKLYYNDTKSESNKIQVDLDFTRDFQNRRNISALPSEDGIKEVLKMTNKFTIDDELNCGACGYQTCRDKAVAVLLDIAEVDMCLPYLISKKTNLLETLENNLNEITTLKDELETIIESSYDGLVVTDGGGKILKSNKSFKKMIGINENDENIDNVQIENIENNKIIFPSATLLALKEKRRISFLQNSFSGINYLSTATPILNNEGEIKRVVTNIRDINELNRLSDQIQETRKLEKYHQNEINNKDNLKIRTDNIVANSIEFGEVLQNASNVAGVDSTILILGESGVGKEVVVKFIHSVSKRRNKSLIKINCGAIPDNLIESELFGYETGAFTGAQKKGKPGLVELANEGTLFLDEIGELPLNLQVKLLRVIQERKLMRIGGTSEIDVDVRIIAATNRDLYEMVNNGEFRLDLYYRLNVVPIDIPPLRKRRSDILPLCSHFLDIFNSKYGCNKDITSSAKKILHDYDWPGNVRELENLIERLVVTTNKEEINENDLPVFLYNKLNRLKESISIDGIVPLKDAIEIVERKLIEEAYKKYKTTYEMAEALGVNQSTIVRKLQKYYRFNALKHN